MVHVIIIGHDGVVNFNIHHHIPILQHSRLSVFTMKDSVTVE